MEPLVHSKVVSTQGTQLKTVKMGLSGAQRRRILSFFSPLLLLVIWEIGVRAGILDERFFPAPTGILSTLFMDVASGQLFLDIRDSLQRILFGFVIGAIPGVAIGLVMGLSKTLRAILDPVISALYPIPKLALMPVVMLIFGLGETEKVVVILLGVIFPVLINTAVGVRNLENIYLDVAKNFGASRLDYYRTVALPGALPMIFTGLKLGIGMALLLIVAAEMQGAQSGIGFRIWSSYNLFDIPAMFVSFLIMMVLGYLFILLVDELETWLLPWKQSK